WLDTGTPEGMIKASVFVQTVQERQGYYIACLEEIAWRRGFITREQLADIGQTLKMTDYGQYLISLLEEGEQTNAYDPSDWRSRVHRFKFHKTLSGQTSNVTHP
ncbi:MAG: glucose-1-phosphate thymidylyltransferase, partial [Exiguobacterium sp.]